MTGGSQEAAQSRLCHHVFAGPDGCEEIVTPADLANRASTSGEVQGQNLAGGPSTPALASASGATGRRRSRGTLLL